MKGHSARGNSVDARVSIITPCWRQAHFLPGAIESVRAQSYPNIQHLVVNDGSDDNTDEVAARYASQILYIRKPNGGLSSARNFGIAHADGQYLHFLDADDLLHPDAITWCVQAVRDRPNALGIMGHRTFQDPAVLGKEKLPSGELALFPSYIHRNYGPPHCYFVSREMVQAAGGFAEHLTACEDWDLWLRLGVRGAQLVPIPHAGAYYRRYDGSMSTQKARMLVNRLQVLLRLQQELFAHPDLLQKWGSDLLEAEHRVRRRCIAQRMERRWVRSLSQAIRALTKQGISLQRSPARRVLETMIGSSTADRLILAYFRRYNAPEFATYANDFM
jgi:glycosyltransferase involved in cell wall biosynthesis